MIALGHGLKKYDGFILCGSRSVNDFEVIDTREVADAGFAEVVFTHLSTGQILSEGRR